MHLQVLAWRQPPLWWPGWDSRSCLLPKNTPSGWHPLWLRWVMDPRKPHGWVFGSECNINKSSLSAATVGKLNRVAQERKPEQDKFGADRGGGDDDETKSVTVLHVPRRHRPPPGCCPWVWACPGPAALPWAGGRHVCVLLLLVPAEAERGWQARHPVSVRRSPPSPAHIAAPTSASGKPRDQWDCHQCEQGAILTSDDCLGLIEQL